MGHGRGIGALMVVLASGALAGAEPEGCCPVPTLIAPPVTIYIQPQPPGPVVGQTVTAPPLTFFPAEASPPRWREAPPPPPIKLFRQQPPPVKLFVGEPPAVKLFHVETKPPLWAEAPVPPPVKVLRVETSVPQYAPKVQQPPVTIYHQPQPPAPCEVVGW